MWFLFGFVSVACFAVFVTYRRMDARWRGTPASAGGGIAFEHKIETYKDKPKHLRIGLPAPEGFDFALKPETPVDGFFKGIGVSDEYQLADPEFDRSIYIVSDDAAFCARLAAAQTLRREILELFQHDTGALRLEGVRCHHGRVWARYGVDKDFNDSRVHAIANRTVPVLHRLSALLKGLPVRGAGLRDPFVLKATLILAAGSALLINGSIQLFRFYWSELPYTVDPWALARPALIAGLAVTVLLGAAALVFLGRSSRTHLVLLDLLISGGFGATSTAYAELRDLNMEMDQSEVRAVEFTVYDKRAGSRRRRYYIYVEPWGATEIRVPRYAFDGLQKGDRVTLYFRQGYLGYTWVERIRGPNELVIQ